MTTVAEVQRRVAEIAAMADDEERAHAAEDQLHQHVLWSIAHGQAEDARRLAEAALTTREIKFRRWCA